MFKKLLILSFVIVATVFAVEKVSAVESSSEVTFENTSDLCHDDRDNDGDDDADENDEDCTDFFVVASTPISENTSELCHDGNDNDGDDDADENDEDCTDFFNSEEVVEETSNNNGSSGGSRRSGGRNNSSSNSSSNVPTTPAVLGASTGPNGEMLTCAPYLVTFMRIGQANNVEEVKKLQSFLNETVGSNLPINGNFGPQTHAAVMALHAKHADQILRPWDTAGLSVNLQPTGYAYKMTQWFINSSMCKGTTIPKPALN
jgi:hypothetical protein